MISRSDEGDARRLLVSIHPRYGEKVRSGEKRAELRRVRPAVVRGDSIVFYETSPTCAIVAYATVCRVVAASPRTLWPLVRDQCCVSREYFGEYFQGRRIGYAIQFRSVAVLDSPIELARIRRHAPQFTPPQSYHYLRQDRAHDRRVVALL